MPSKIDYLIEFYGVTCPHCEVMKPVVDKLEKKLNIQIDKKEVWQNSKNQQEMSQYLDVLNEACGGMAGVPTFLNTKTMQALCGEQTLENLIIWAQGGVCEDNICKPHSKNTFNKSA